MVTASPLMYPIWVGLDSRSATNPTLTSPATTMITPTRIARSEANAIALAGSPPATISGITVAAIMGPNAESGPRTNTFDGPKTAYPRRHRIDVYSPVIGG